MVISIVGKVSFNDSTSNFYPTNIQLPAYGFPPVRSKTYGLGMFVPAILRSNAEKYWQLAENDQHSKWKPAKDLGTLGAFETKG